jgi:hypothetical protein
MSLKDIDYAKAEVQVLDERKMYVDALKKWYFIKLHTDEYQETALELVHQRFPELEDYISGCSFCSRYKYVKQYEVCETCPLRIKNDGLTCNDLGSIYYAWISVIDSKDKKELAEVMFEMIEELAIERGFVIGEEEYV